jgi:hypothetical protein
MHIINVIVKLLLFGVQISLQNTGSAFIFAIVFDQDIVA